MVGGTITGCVFGMRYGRVEKDMRVVRPETPSLKHLRDEQSDTFEIQHSDSFGKKPTGFGRKQFETFERRERSSSSSSSSDED
jgi:hypothetical protein